MTTHSPQVYNPFHSAVHTRRYIKPTLCSREFLSSLALAHRPHHDWSHHIAKEGGLDISRLTEVHLEFQNIQTMHGIGFLRSCRKLRLNNNIINNIHGLEDLTELRSLDLSFNRINKIGGLDKCVKLEELSLFHNQIKTVAGVEQLKKLVLLSLGCNQLQQLSDIHPLRKLPALRSLTLERNPLSQFENYRQYVVVWLPQLRVFDWKRILPKFQTEANEVFKDDYQTFCAAERREERNRRHQKGEGGQPHNPTSASNETPLFHELLERYFAIALESEEETVEDRHSAETIYKERIANSFDTIKKAYGEFVDLTANFPVTFDNSTPPWLDGYEKAGRLLIEQVIMLRHQRLHAIMDEVESKEKEEIKRYVHLLDQVQQDILNLLIQLQLKMDDLHESFNKEIREKKALFDVIVQRELEIVRETERVFEERNQQIRTIMRDSQEHCITGQAHAAPPLGSSEQASDENNLSFRLNLLQRIPEAIEQSWVTRVKQMNQELIIRQEAVYYPRMRELLDFFDQHRAEAFLVRRKVMARLGLQVDKKDEEDLRIKPGVKSIMNRRNKASRLNDVVAVSTSLVRPRDVQFESDEPLADHTFMKDFKEIIDEIAPLSQEERQRLFQIRVLETDDIADYIEQEDEHGEQEFDLDPTDRTDDDNEIVDDSADSVSDEILG